MINIIFSAILIIALAALIVILARRMPDVRRIMGLPEKKRDGLKPGKPILPQLTKKQPPKDIMYQADELFSAKKYSEAEKLYVQIAASDPNNAKVYNRLGVIFLEQDNFSDAKSAFNEALKLDKKIASRWYNLGLASTGLEEHRNALEAYENAYKLDKKNEKYAGTYRGAKAKLKKYLEKK